MPVTSAATLSIRAGALMPVRTELAQMIDRLTPSERGRLLARLKRYDQAKREIEWLMRRPTKRGAIR